jgi:formate dehydrogenase subunit gamma
VSSDSNNRNHPPETKSSIPSHAKGLIIAGVLLLVCTLILPTLPYVWLSGANNSVQATEFEELNPRSNFWREVRTGGAGYTTNIGPDAAVLIHDRGETWRQFRSGFLVPYGGYLMGFVLALIAGFYALRGPVLLENGESGQLVFRFSSYQRVVHWFTAILFWLLALSGLILLYGRLVLKPLLGSTGFAVTASACKEAHNLFGPIFIIALLLLFLAYVKDNLYEKGDLNWLRKGGGMFGQHASAGRFNFGEKAWFWLVCILGLAISVSGLVLDFSNLGMDRGTLELSHVAHSVAAILFISISFGHIYLGVVGTQGSLRGMTTGYVDANWAKHHHDRWKPELLEPVEIQGPVSGAGLVTEND